MAKKKSSSEGTSTISTAYHGRLPNAEYEAFKGMAAADGRSLSNLLTKVLVEWLATQAAKKK